MPATLRRRLVRWTVIVAVAPVLLASWYIGAWLAISKAANSRMISYQSSAMVRPVFTPLIQYSESQLPGASPLNRAWYFLVARVPDSDPVVWTIYADVAPLMPSHQ